LLLHPSGYRLPLSARVNAKPQKVGAEFAAEAETHIRDEHSTFDWRIEGLLNRAGFRIDQAEYMDGYGATYFCSKSKE
jgi:putative AdoMet-dependent methyltransferase